MPQASRHRARLRPAGDAGDRRATHRAGDLDAGGRAVNRRGKSYAMKTLRTPAQLCEHGLVAARAARRAWTRSPRATRWRCRSALAELIDRERSARSDRAPVRSRCGRTRHAAAGAAPTRSATTRIRPVEGIVHRYPDRVLLKLTPVCAVYCRFCFRREMVGPEQGQGAVGGGARARARLYPQPAARSGK